MPVEIPITVNTPAGPVIFGLSEHITSGDETVTWVGGELDLVWTVRPISHPGFDSPLHVRAIIMANTPVISFNQLIRQNLNLKHQGRGIYQVKVHYSKLDNKIKVTMECMSEKVHKVRSIKTLEKIRVRDIAGLGATAPDFDRFIGVTKDKIEGVSVYQPGFFKMHMSWNCKFTGLDPAFIQTVKNMQSTMNDTDLFFQWKNQVMLLKKHSLLFIGAIFEETSDDGCAIQLRFEGMDGKDDIDLGERDGSDNNLHAFISKDGWDYIWVRSVKRPRTIGSILVDAEVADCAYIEQMFYEDDFSKLNVFDKVQQDPAQAAIDFGTANEEPD